MKAPAAIDATGAGRAAIEARLAPDGTLDRDALLALLPYGREFLFVDRVSRLERRRARAAFRIPGDAPWVRSHFRHLPLMPGALIVEGWAQTGTLLVRYNLEQPAGKLVLGMQIERTRFDSPAFPGETLLYSVELRSLNARAARLEGEVHVGERRIAKARVVVGIMAEGAVRELAGS